MGCGSSSHARGAADDSSVGGGKLCDAAQVNELKGGTADHYFKGLQRLSGLPAGDLSDDSLHWQMHAEHCLMRGHDKAFDCESHYEKQGKITPQTTAQQEWLAVVKGNVPPSLEKFRLRECYRKTPKGRNVGVYQYFPKDRSCSLSDPERLGLALYTGPMFSVYNGILRREILPKKKGEEDPPSIASLFLGSDFGEGISKGPAAAPSAAYDAIASVYTNAETLLLLIFNKFDKNEDLCISAQEMNEAISDLLRMGKLDDSIMKVVDYFSAVDRDGDNRVEFSEALKHCFPYVPEERLLTLKKWLHPQKYDVDLYRVLDALAKEISTNQEIKETLASIQRSCGDFIQKQSGVSTDDARLRDLQNVSKGFVSNFAVFRTLRTVYENNGAFINKLDDWEKHIASEATKNVADVQGPNFFSATIFVISSAIQKLSSQTSVPHSLKLYRGYKDTTIPEHLKEYCEFGFLSTSRVPDTAQTMARGGASQHGLVVEFEAPIGGYADIRQYSQFPDEDEFLFAPMCYIKFEERPKESKSGIVISGKWKAVVHRSLAPTVESLRDQEKMMHLQLFWFNRCELVHRLESRLKEWLKGRPALLSSGRPETTLTHQPMDIHSLDEMCKLCDQEGRNIVQGDPGTTLFVKHPPITTKNVFERILGQYDEVFESHQKCDASDFGKDDFFRQRTSEMLDSKRWCEQKLELWLQNLEDGVQSDLSLGIFFYPLQQSFKFWISNLRRQIEDLRGRLELSPTDQKSKDREGLKQLCIRLLVAKGFVPSDGAKDTNDVLSYLGTASVNGWGEEDLHALLDQNDDISTIITQPVPHFGTSCIHLAAAHGSDFFLRTIFEYMCKKTSGNHQTNESVRNLPPSIVHNQGVNGKGESPLFLAAESGHASCIKVLLQFCPALPELNLSPLCAAVSRSHLSCVKLLLLEPLINRSSNGFTPLMRAVSRCDAEMVVLLLSAGAVEQTSCHWSHASAESDMELMLKQTRLARSDKHASAIKDLLEQRRKSQTLDEFRNLPHVKVQLLGTAT